MVGQHDPNSGTRQRNQVDDPTASDQPPARSEPAPPVLAQPQPQFPAVVQQGNGLAVAGLVLGIIGAVLYVMIGIFSFGAGFFI